MKIRRYVMARRRGVVAVVAAALVATAAPLGAVATSVPEPEPTASPAPVAMSIEETQTVLDAYIAALLAREDIAPYFSDDAVFELVDVGQRIEGRDEVAAAIVELHEQTFDARPEVTNVVIGEGTAAAEAVFVGTHTGDFAGIPARASRSRCPMRSSTTLPMGRSRRCGSTGSLPGWWRRSPRTLHRHRGRPRHSSEAHLMHTVG